MTQAMNETWLQISTQARTLLGNYWRLLEITGDYLEITGDY